VCAVFGVSQPHAANLTDNRKAPTFRKDRTVRIIELELDSKGSLANQHAGLRRPDVVSEGNPKKRKPVLDDNLEMSSDGSGAMEDNALGPDESVVDDEEEEEGEQDGGEEGAGRARAVNGQIKGAKGRNERVMSVAEVRNHLRLLFKNEQEMCILLFGRHGGLARPNTSTSHLADMFFMDIIPVTPTRFRPASKLGDDLFENSQNSLLSAAITTCRRIRELHQRIRDHDNMKMDDTVLDAIAKTESIRAFEQLLEALIKLQHDVNSYMDSTKNPTIMRQGKLPPQGVKQLLEKKEGLFRKHMMVGLQMGHTDDTGQASQLRRSICHFARHQYRNK